MAVPMQPGVIKTLLMYIVVLTTTTPILSDMCGKIVPIGWQLGFPDAEQTLNFQF